MGDQQESALQNGQNTSPQHDVDEHDDFGEPSEKRTRKDSKSGSDRTTDEYMKKRARNNLAVKKSRDRSKQRILETQNRVDQLTKENEDLQTKVTLLSKELNVLRALFTSGGFTLPCNVQIIGTSVQQRAETTKPSILTTHANGSKTTTPHKSTPTYVNFPKQQTTRKETRVENHTSVIRTAHSINSPTMAYGVVATK